MGKGLLILFLIGVLLISGCRINPNSSNKEISICSHQQKNNLKFVFYYDTGSMNIKNGTKLYYNITKEPEINDIVIVKDSEYQTIENNEITGFAHRVWSKPAEFYITKGDNNKFVDGVYKREMLEGVIICKYG